MKIIDISKCSDEVIMYINDMQKYIDKKDKEIEGLQDDYDIANIQANYFMDLSDDLVEENERLNNIINETEKEIDRLLERQYESERFAKEQGFDTYLPAKENLLCIKNKLQDLKGSGSNE